MGLHVARHVHLVVDGVTAEMVEHVAIAVPDGLVCVEMVGGGDTVWAGNLVAQLALGHGSAGRVIAHDMRPGPRDPGSWPAGRDGCFCVARSRTGALVVGPNAGWVWSAALPGLTDLMEIDVWADGLPPYPAVQLATAVRHAVAGHPHTVAGRIDRVGVPAPALA
jgi:hypothetical protein